MFCRLTRELANPRNSGLCRVYSVQVLNKDDATHGLLESSRVDQEWENGKPFSAVPRVNMIKLSLECLPGGSKNNISLVEMHRRLIQEYGPTIYIPGILRRRAHLLVSKAEVVEKVFRHEGVWPTRHGLDTFCYFRQKVRPDIFKNAGGLITEHGKSWYDFRTIINPLLLKPKNVAYYIGPVGEISDDFIKRIKKIRDPDTLETPASFGHETNRWTLESIYSIALNTRLGLLDHTNVNEGSEKLVECVKEFFQLTFELDFLPSLWRYYETRGLKKLMRSFETITEICLNSIQEAKRKIEANPNVEDLSILAQLLKYDEHKATVLAMDLLIAGVDTTTAAFLSLMYRLAKNPEKQEILRKEVLRVIPNKDDPVTEDTLRNLPYLRACFKEMLRLTAITSGTVRLTIRDMVLDGYQVPKGTNVLIAGMVISNDSNYFSNPDKFIPERWLRTDIDEVKACPMAKSKNPYAFIPFGFGPRSCIGKRLAELEIEVMMLKLLRNFKIEWHHPDMQYRYNIITTPTGDIRFKLIDIP